MKKGGILEGFPAYLLGSESHNAPTVIIDNPELGRVNLFPVPEGSRLNIVVSADRDLLEHTRETITPSKYGDLQLIQAAPGHYPFRDSSVGTVLTLTSGKRETHQGSFAETTTAAMPPEIARILSSDGCMIELTSGRAAKTAGESPVTRRWSGGHCYFIRPPSGDHYFVSKEGIPVQDALGQVHHGRLRSLQIKANDLLSRPGKDSLRDSVRAAINSPGWCQPLIERLVDKTEEVRLDALPRPNAGKSFGLFVKVDWNALFLSGNQGGTITKLPLRGDVLAKMEASTNTLNVLHNIEDPALHSVLPDVVGHGSICGQAYWIEKRIEGTPVTKLWWKPASKKQAVRSGFQFLSNLQQSTAKPIQIDRRLFNTLVDPQLECVDRRVKQGYRDFDLETLHTALWTLFQGRRIPLVRTHGDLWLGNLLVSEDGQLVGVLDWDLSQKNGWPLIDLLHLLTFQQKWLAVWHFGRLVTWKLLPRRLSSWENTMVEDYCATLSIEDDLWPGFVALYWLHRAAQVVAVFDNAWFRRNVVNPLPTIIDRIYRVQSLTGRPVVGA